MSLRQHKSVDSEKGRSVAILNCSLSERTKERIGKRGYSEIYSGHDDVSISDFLKIPARENNVELELRIFESVYCDIEKYFSSYVGASESKMVKRALALSELRKEIRSTLNTIGFCLDRSGGSIFVDVYSHYLTENAFEDVFDPEVRVKIITVSKIRFFNWCLEGSLIDKASVFFLTIKNCLFRRSAR